MCDCIAQMNEGLMEHNTELEIPIMTSKASETAYNLSASTRVVIATEKIESRKRTGPVKLFANFCPFCGEKYDTD